MKKKELKFELKRAQLKAASAEMEVIALKHQIEIDTQETRTANAKKTKAMAYAERLKRQLIKAIDKANDGDNTDLQRLQQKLKTSMEVDFNFQQQ